ncbi:unnamed protein product [Notodromas monacha]|uniref:Uncharacterized protein n=1 Tax=Notodromas monacha TaxID=399045 RepID=A0A7R9GH26_9CRUS|nr:unnamed protein product [Notodromas monacha]CAG0922325.1 unnamed protein product [Notodromas monacha]
MTDRIYTPPLKMSYAAINKFSLEKYQMLNIASLAYCCAGVPCLAAHFHAMKKMPLNFAYAHLFLTILPYVLFNRRKYEPLYEAARLTTLFCLFTMGIVAVAAVDPFSLAAIIMIWVATTRIGTSARHYKGITYYHWFILLIALAALIMSIPFSPCLYKKLPDGIKSNLEEWKKNIEQTPPWPQLNEALGRNQEPAGGFLGFTYAQVGPSLEASAAAEDESNGVLY